MERVDLEIFGLYLQATVEIVVQSVCGGVEYWEGLWATHEAEEVLEKVGVSVHEVGAIGVRGPREALR